MKLSGNTIMITGGGSGIGLAFAKTLSAKSNTVIICGRNLERLEEAKKEGFVTDYFQCDLSTEEDQKKLVEYIQLNHPNTNMLINNAGIQHNYTFDEKVDHRDVIEEEVNTNFIAQVKLTDKFLPVLLKQRKSSIVNITSALAVVPKQSAPVYCATKAAMRVFTKVLRYQLENSVVNVIEVVPALVDTAMTKGRGKGKISPEELVREALDGIESDKKEIRIGKTKILFLLERIIPSLAGRIIRHG